MSLLKSKKLRQETKTNEMELLSRRYLPEREAMHCRYDFSIGECAVPPSTQQARYVRLLFKLYTLVEKAARRDKMREDNDGVSPSYPNAILQLTCVLECRK
jgi:hypothetical protein